MKLSFVSGLIGLLILVSSITPLVAQNDSTTVINDTTKLVADTEQVDSDVSESQDNKANFIDENGLKSSGNLAMSIPRGILGMGVLILIAFLSFPCRRESRQWENPTFYEIVNIGRSMFDVHLSK